MSAVNVYDKPSPVLHLKSIKNEIELSAARDCHLRDGAALVEFFSWLDDYLGSHEGEKGLDEVEIDLKLNSFRQSQEKFIEPSFPTIAGVNENGAIIHYRLYTFKSYTFKRIE